MGHQLSIFAFILSFHTLLTVGLANANSLTTKVSQPKFKASVETNYFDFQGRHPADGNIYSFENVNLRVQGLTLSYLASPTLQFSVVAQHIRNYAETNFGPIYTEDTTEGMGDTRLKATKTWFSSLGLIIGDFGVSLPTGSISEKNRLAPALNYPYNMQLGTGTYDVESSLIWMKFKGKHQIGSMGYARLHNGRNNFGYRRGNEYLLKAWYNYAFNQYFSPGIWLNFRHLQRFSGQDSTYGRLDVTEFYHTPRNFWDFTPNVQSSLDLFDGIKLKGLLARPLWQESKNIDNIQVYMTWFAQLGLEGQF